MCGFLGCYSGGHQGEQGSQQWGQTHLGAKGDYFQHEEHQEGLDSEREVRSPMDYGEFGDWQSMGVFHGVHHYGQGNCQVG